MNVQAFGADIDPASIEHIRLQAEAMKLPVQVEQAAFGEGFPGQTFDRILFFEAFHHSFDFLSLLPKLRNRLAPGGKLILRGEPVVGHALPAVPFPWGPRLDALSIFCMRHLGWMELGFTEPFLMEALQRSGYRAAVHPFPICGRAHAYTAKPTDESEPVTSFESIPPQTHASNAPDAELRSAQVAHANLSLQYAELATQHEALLRSTSWRLTLPLRTAVNWWRKT